MRVDEARQHHAASGVESLRTARHWMGFNLRAGAYSGDEAIGDKHRSIFLDSYVRKGSATAGSAST
jgi:hypothetical protein